MSDLDYLIGKANLLGVKLETIETIGSVLVQTPEGNEYMFNEDGEYIKRS